MNIPDWQTLVVMACVAIAAGSLLRPAVRRWRVARLPGQTPSGQVVDAGAARPAACGSCKACSAGGCH